MGTGGWIAVTLLAVGALGVGGYLLYKSQTKAAAAPAAKGSTTGDTLSGVGNLLAGLGKGLDSFFDGSGQDGYGSSPSYTGGSEDWGWG